MKPLPCPAESMLEEARCSGSDAGWDAKSLGAAWRQQWNLINPLTRQCVVYALMGYDFAILTSQAYQHMFY